MALLMWALVSVLSVLLLPLPADSQPSDDRIIVPGARIGKATLAMTVDALVGMLGPPTTVFEGFRHFGVKSQPGVLALDWTGPLGLGVATKDDRTVLVLYSCGAPRYETAKGVKHGAARASVESAYGRPTATIQTGIGTTVIYESLGLAVWSYQSVECIAVFRPGTARRAWRF